MDGMVRSYIASGSDANEVARLGDYEPYFDEHDWAELRLQFKEPVGAEWAGNLDRFLQERGLVNTHRVEAEGSELVLYIRKELPIAWPAVALAVLVLVGFLILLWVGWQLFSLKPVAKAAGDVATNIGEGFASVPFPIWALLGVAVLLKTRSGAGAGAGGRAGG